MFWKNQITLQWQSAVDSCYKKKMSRSEVLLPAKTFNSICTEMAVLLHETFVYTCNCIKRKISVLA